MNILFYLGHPAQYHFVKNTARQLRQHGHQVRLLIKTKDMLEDLLKEEGWAYENIQPTFRKNGKLTILLASLQRTWKTFRAARQFGADILVGTDSSVAQAAWLLSKPAITTLEDDYAVIKNLAKLTYPFTSSILVPACCDVGKWDNKKVPYYGYMKLAYLHPACFTPDESVIRHYGIAHKYVLIRLAKLVAHHDAGIGGLDISQVKDIIAAAQAKGYQVYISSEVALLPELEPCRLNIHYKDIHHVLSFASMLISDSQSMSVEAAMLGVPSIRFSDFSGRISVLEELEETYNLTIGVKTCNPDKLMNALADWLAKPDLHETFRQRRKKMLEDKINVSAFFTWFIENYPESRKMLKNDPDYQLRFK